MSGYTYKNTTDQQLTVVGVGVVEAGGQITTVEPVENPNLELISGAAPASVQAQELPAAEQQPQAVAQAPVAPVAPVQVQKQEEAN